MRRILPLLSLLLALSFGAYLYASDGYTASPSTPVSITGPDGVCKKVTNANAASEYIPTASTAEWQSFYGNPPAGVTIAACTCTLPWGGTAAEGQSVTAYAAGSVACGSSCVTQTRTCSNGTLSGSYTASSCTVQACSFAYTVNGGVNVNLCAVAGNPSQNGTYTFNIYSTVGSYTTSYPALTTGTCWHAGQTVVVKNYGYIEGMGGAGAPGQGYSAVNGSSGGAALAIQYPITLTNSGGIYGGGGGGGSGGACWPDKQTSGTGGNGQGYTTSGGPGAGGSTSATTLWYEDSLTCVTGAGGAGGSWGAYGANGSGAYSYWGNGGSSAGTSGTSGGPGGPAITGSGYGITWISYGDVRGAVQ